MSRLRQSTVRNLHSCIGAAAVDWAKYSAETRLRGYCFRRGISHLLSSGAARGAEALLTRFDYAVARLASQSGLGAHSIAQDASAVCYSVQPANSGQILEWSQFFIAVSHLISQGDSNWGAEKILLQCAIEYADESVVTQAAEAWLGADQCDWSWLRHIRRRVSAAAGPCARTLVFGDDEPSHLCIWSGRLVFCLDSGCQLVVMNETLEQPEFQYESVDYLEQISGIVTQRSDVLIFWSEASVWSWSPEWAGARRLASFSRQTITSVVVALAGRLVVCLSSGGVYLICPEDPVPTLLYEGEFVAQSGWCSPGGWLVYRLAEASDDEWSDTEDDADDEEDETEDDWEDDDCEEEEEDDGDEDDVDEWDDDDWDDEEDEGGRPEFLILKLGSAGTVDVAQVVCPDTDSAVRALLPLSDDRAICLRADGTLESWSLADGTRAANQMLAVRLQTDEAPIAVLNGHIVAWSLDGEVLLFDQITLEPKGSLDGHSDIISTVIEWGDEGLLSCGHDAEIRHWALDTLSCITVMKTDSPHGLVGLLPLSDGGLLSWGFNNYMTVWDVPTGSERGSLTGHTSSISEVVALPTGALASSVMFASDLKIWDLTRLGHDTPLDEHDDVIAFACRRGDQLVTGSHDQSLRVWNPHTGKHLRTFSGHTAPLNAGHWLDDHSFVSAAWDFESEDDESARADMIRWRTRTCDEQVRYVGHTDWIRDVEVLDQRRLLTWSDDGDLRLWDADTGRCEATLSGHQAAVRGGLSLNLERWLSWSEDGSLRLWQLSTGSCVGVVDTGFEYPFQATGLPDGRIVAWSDASKGSATVKVWSADSLTLVSSRSYGDHEVQSVTARAGLLWIRYAHGPIVSWDESTQEEQPQVWTASTVRLEHQAVWAQLNSRDSSTHQLGPFRGYGTTQKVLLEGPKDQELAWFADGSWSLHDLQADGLLIATCWNRLAILQLYRGAHRVGLYKVETEPDGVGTDREKLRYEGRVESSSKSKKTLIREDC